LTNKNIFVVQNIELGSTNALSIQLTNNLRNIPPSQDLNISLIVAKSEDIPDVIEENYQAISQIEGSYSSVKDNIRFSLKAYQILRSAHKKKNIDIIHCLYPNSSLLGAVLFKLLVNSKVMIIYEVRSPWIEMIFARKHIYSSFDRLIKFTLFIEESFLLRFADHLIFISNGLYEYYTKKHKINSQTCTIIPSGVDTSYFQPGERWLRKTLGLSDEDIVIGYVGALGAVRELDIFVEHFEKLIKNDKRLKMVFVGSGNDLARLQWIVNAKGLSGAVKFIGEVPSIEILGYFNMFDFGLSHLPDLFVYRQCFPLKILEYLACGVPVLASDIQAHSDISKMLEGVFLYKDSTDILDIIRSQRKKIYQDMSSFSWSKLAKTYQDIYLSL